MRAKFPLGMVFKVKANPHKVPAGALCQLLRYDNPPHWDYMVKFLPEHKYEAINSKGPFMRNEHLRLTKTIRILYGLSKSKR